MTFYDIIEINTFDVTRKVIDTLPLPEGYDDQNEFLEEYLKRTTRFDHITYIMEITSLYDEPRYDLRDDSVVMYFINSSEELEYTIYTEEDGGTMPINSSIENMVYEIE